MGLVSYISDRVRGKAPKGARRSKSWGKVRREHLKKSSRCVVCSKRKKLEVHHIIPFYLAPHLELESSNLLTLCRGTFNCHLLVGHLGDYRAINPKCGNDVWLMSKRLEKGREMAARAREVYEDNFKGKVAQVDG